MWNEGKPSLMSMCGFSLTRALFMPVSSERFISSEGFNKTLYALGGCPSGILWKLSLGLGHAW